MIHKFKIAPGFYRDEGPPSCVEESLAIPGPAGKLEAMTLCPEGEMRGMAILCHPHPLYGGNMHNKVVHYLSKTLTELGFGTVRFNFRGVGESEGSYGDGIGEQGDLEAVLDWALARRGKKVREIWLAGFSFGAFVSYAVASRRSEPQHLLTVAPPVNLFDFTPYAAPRCSWLIVQGGEDEIVPCDDVKRWLLSHPANPDWLCIDDAGHFFHGQLNVFHQALLKVMEP